MTVTSLSGSSSSSESDYEPALSALSRTTLSSSPECPSIVVTPPDDTVPLPVLVYNSHYEPVHERSITGGLEASSLHIDTALRIDRLNTCLAAHALDLLLCSARIHDETHDQVDPGWPVPFTRLHLQRANHLRSFMPSSARAIRHCRLTILACDAEESWRRVHEWIDAFCTALGRREGRALQTLEIRFLRRAGAQRGPSRVGEMVSRWQMRLLVRLAMLGGVPVVDVSGTAMSVKRWGERAIEYGMGNERPSLLPTWKSRDS